MFGRVTSGAGQASCFLSQEGYRKRFLHHLGFIPFPGTLNVLMEAPLPDSEKAFLIEGFFEGERSFGGCLCRRITINGLDAAVVKPERSRYPPELVEVMAPVQLRRALGLRDGDAVEIILL